MIAKAILCVICLLRNKNPVLSGKLDKETPKESRVALKENLRTKPSALSEEDINTSN